MSTTPVRNLASSIPRPVESTPSSCSSRCSERRTYRESRRLNRYLREAKLKLSHACIEDIDYPAARHLDRTMIRQLATCRWVAERQDATVTGATGVGKTYVACALAQQACRSPAFGKQAREARRKNDALEPPLELGCQCRLEPLTSVEPVHRALVDPLFAASWVASEFRSCSSRCAP